MSSMTRNRSIPIMFLMISWSSITGSAPLVAPVSSLLKEFSFSNKGMCFMSLVVIVILIILLNPELSGKTPPEYGSKDQIGGWKKVTDAVHAEGSVIYAQVCARFFL